MSAIASALVCTLKLVNSFARRQHLFGTAATLIDVNSNFLSYPAPLCRSNFAQVQLFNLRTERNADSMGQKT